MELQQGWVLRLQPAPRRAAELCFQQAGSRQHSQTSHPALPAAEGSLLLLTLLETEEMQNTAEVAENVWAPGLGSGGLAGLSQETF